MRRVLGLLGAIAIVGAACGGTSEGTPTANALLIAFHAVPADSLAVSDSG